MPSSAEMVRLLERSTWTAAAPDDRVMGGWVPASGAPFVGLLEYVTAVPPTIPMLRRIWEVESRLPVHGRADVFRKDEAQTFKPKGFYRIGKRVGLMYECPQLPMTLHEVIAQNPTPSREIRARLALRIATTVRSLHVHFDVRHPDLRAQSFVFLRLGSDGLGLPDVDNPILLDWARDNPPPSIYQHPSYGKTSEAPQWTWAAFSLLMVLSEIVEWRPLDKPFRDEAELLQMKKDRVQSMRTTDWKAFPVAVAVLDGPNAKRYSRWDVKRFYDWLCDNIAKPPPRMPLPPP